MSKTLIKTYFAIASKERLQLFLVVFIKINL